MSSKLPSICICTSFAADREPRAPRHAAALADCGLPRTAFVDAAPAGQSRVPLLALDQVPDLDWRTLPIPHRKSGGLRLALSLGWGRLARTRFQKFDSLSNSALNPRLSGYQRLLDEVAADIYYAHNVDTLLPAWTVARRRKALLLFDSMEFHSDMGHGQTPTEQQLIRKIESQCLPDCALITASSPEVAEALAQQYQLTGIVPTYNTPARTDELLPRLPGFNLYWRNAVVNTGQRGLQDILFALTELPRDIRLHLQGRMPADGGQSLRSEIQRLQLTDRIQFHPPYRPDQAVREASRFQVGLCLEQPSNRNHDLTVSNKMFDYHMAGLAVISSDLPGLRNVIASSGGGLCYRAGDVTALKSAVRSFYDDRSALEAHARQARSFALQQGCLENALSVFRAALAEAVQDAWPEFAALLTSRSDETHHTEQGLRA